MSRGMKVPLSLHVSTRKSRLTPKRRHGGNYTTLQTQDDKVVLTRMCYETRDQAVGAQIDRKLQSMLSAAHLSALFFCFPGQIVRRRLAIKVLIKTCCCLLRSTV